MISFRDVRFSYGERQVLRGLTLDLSERRIGIIGGNGSGKSTLVRLINGLLMPTSGTVTVDGNDTKTRTKAVRASVGFVFQDADLQIIMPTVAEDLAFGLRSLKLPKDQVKARVDHWLEKYGLIGHRDHPAHLLSGGQKQLLAIAAVLITEPTIVVFDEPTTLLDLRNKAMVMDVVASLDQQVVVVTHDLEFLSDFDRVLFIDQGRVGLDGNPTETIASYRKLALSPQL